MTGLPTLMWLPRLYIAVVFGQSLYFKFTDSMETMYIFSTIADWMRSQPALEAAATPMMDYGGFVIGGVELIAVLLLLTSPLMWLGALLSLAVITGALFFHLFTPLGIEVQGDGGLLFYMACGVFGSALVLLIWSGARERWQPGR